MLVLIPIHTCIAEVILMKVVMIFGRQLVEPVDFRSPHGKIANTGKESYIIITCVCDD